MVLLLLKGENFKILYFISFGTFLSSSLIEKLFLFKYLLMFKQDIF